jgi:hypothetical protein
MAWPDPKHNMRYIKGSQVSRLILDSKLLFKTQTAKQATSLPVASPRLMLRLSKTGLLEADGKCPYARLPKSRRMRRT